VGDRRSRGRRRKVKRRMRVGRMSKEKSGRKKISKW
jgi:hypothetical protein